MTILDPDTPLRCRRDAHIMTRLLLTRHAIHGHYDVVKLIGEFTSNVRRYMRPDDGVLWDEYTYDAGFLIPGWVTNLGLIDDQRWVRMIALYGSTWEGEWVARTGLCYYADIDVLTYGGSPTVDYTHNLHVFYNAVTASRRAIAENCPTPARAFAMLAEWKKARKHTS